MSNATEMAVNQLKAYGRYIMDNAETIVGSIDKPTWVAEGGIRVSFRLGERESAPVLEVSHEYIVIDAWEVDK